MTPYVNCETNSFIDSRSFKDEKYFKNIINVASFS